MASVNKVIIVGNLGRDPEIRYLPDGTGICTVSLATSSTWKDKSTGQKREEVEWHRVVFFNRLADIVNEYLRKGRAVYIEGRLKTRKWEDKKTGRDRYATEIVAENMQMLGGRDDTGGSSQQRAPNEGQSHTNDAPDGGAVVAPAANLADMDDDIPF